jgi:hypothetical protein
MHALTPLSAAILKQMNPNKPMQVFYDKFGRKVTPADQQLIVEDQDRRNSAMKALKRKLKVLEARSTSMKF